MREYEAMCECLYGQGSSQQRSGISQNNNSGEYEMQGLSPSQANHLLQKFNEAPENFGKLRFFFENSQNSHCQYLACSGMKNLLEYKYFKIGAEKRTQTRNWVYQLLISGKLLHL